MHMANIHQDGNSIRNIHVVSSNRVHSTHLCEAKRHKNDLPPTLDILPGCWPRPHVLTFVKVSKNTQMNFPYHTESVSQHVHHFKPIKQFEKNIGRKNYFPRRGDGENPFAENSAKIINLILEPFPSSLMCFHLSEIVE